jgi:hypothetical protein
MGRCNAKVPFFDVVDPRVPYMNKRVDLSLILASIRTGCGGGENGGSTSSTPDSFVGIVKGTTGMGLYDSTGSTLYGATSKTDKTAGIIFVVTKTSSSTS